MARPSVRVRPAAQDDVLALASVVQSIDTTAGPFSGMPLANSSTDHLVRRFSEILERDDRVLLVACDEAEQVVGMLAARRDEIGAIDLTPVMHVTHLLVLPAYRRRGVGRALLAAMVSAADEAGVEHLVASLAAGSREGNRYLARLGFAPLVMHRIAPTATLRRSLGLTDVAGRVAVLRRARLARTQRTGFAARTASRGA